MKKTQYDKLTQNYQKDLFKTLKDFVAINSEYDEKTASENDPFGVGVSAALDFMVDLAENDGFSATNYDNKVVEIICGQGEKSLVIMAHADVVPAGDNWETNPYVMTEKKGILYGRGVSDDKGPLLASYYAMKALRDKGLIDGYQIRFLVGGNEERGSLCMEHYFHTLKKPQPTLGFSPDSDFPIVYGEKGIINFNIETKINIPGLHEIKGGSAINAVIDKCDIVMDLDLKFLDFIMKTYHRKEAEIHTHDDKTTVTFFGKAAHGSTPDQGVNGGMFALTALAKYTKNEELTRIVKMLTPLDGAGYKCAGKSKEMGHNTSNVGLVSYEDGVLTIGVNFRYVDTCNKKDLVNNLKECAKPAKVKILGESPLLYYSPDSPLISTLLQAYRDETGDYRPPITIGGGTYAKEADNVVAFGMQLPEFDTLMHSPGERMRRVDLVKAMSIYARAIVELGKLLK